MNSKEEHTEKIINEVNVRICDRFPVRDEYDFDEELVAFLRGELVKREVKDNQDGSVDLVLWFKAKDYEIKRFDE